MGTQSESWIDSIITFFKNANIENAEREGFTDDLAEPLIEKSPIEIAYEVAATLCRRFEGLRLSPYICPAGYPTQGYGTVFKPNGRKVKITDQAITKEVAEEWLRFTLINTYIPGVLAASPNLIKYPRILGALASFAYNLGVPRYRASTLRRRINAEDWENAVTELLKWDKGRINGRLTKLRGLTLRRKAEAVYIG